MAANMPVTQRGGGPDVSQGAAGHLGTATTDGLDKVATCAFIYWPPTVPLAVPACLLLLLLLLLPGTRVVWPRHASSSSPSLKY